MAPLGEEKNKWEEAMDGIYFFILWVGGALLHTLYELKVKPYLAAHSRDTEKWPYV